MRFPKISYFLKIATVVAVPIFALNSCVDESYDISKPIDTNITALKNFSLPIGSVNDILLEDMFDINTTENISVDANGDFIFNYNNKDKIYQKEFVVPNFVLGTFTSSMHNYVATNIPIPPITEDISITSQNFYYTIEINKDLPSEIVDIKSVEIENGNLQFYFSFNQTPNLVNNLYLGAGTTIDLPEWIVIGDIDNTKFALNQSNNVLTTVVDIPLSKTPEVLFEIPVIRLELNHDTVLEGQGIVGNKLIINQKVPIKADIKLHQGDVLASGVMEKFSFMAKVVINSPVIKNLTAIFNPDFNVKLPSLLRDKLPSFLQNPEAKLDLVDVRLDLDVSNTTPISAKLKFDIVPKEAGVAQNDKIINIQDVIIKGGSIATPCVSKYSLSNIEGNVKDDTYTNIVQPKINRLLFEIPDEIAFENGHLDFLPDYVTIVPNDNHRVTLLYDFVARLAFGPELYLDFSSDINDLNVNLGQDVKVKSAELSFDAISTLPLDFNLDLKAIDNMGNINENLEVQIENGLKSGTLDKPSKTNIKCTILSKDGLLSLEGLRVFFKAVSEPSGEFVGVSLNKQQSIRLENIVLRIPDGISMDINVNSAK